MRELTDADHHALLRAIALKEGNAREISQRFDIPTDELRAYVKQNEEILTRIRQAEEAKVTVDQLDELWISNKNQRLSRLQNVADQLYTDIMFNSGSNDSTVLREFRSYLAAAANELGQLLHRGAGEGGTDTLNVLFDGVDTDLLK